MLQLFSILFAIILGHSCRKLPVSQGVLNTLLNISVLTILFIMGYDFGSNIYNLSSEIVNLLKLVITFTFFLLVINFLFCYIFGRIQSKKNIQNISRSNPPLLSYIIASGKYLFYVIDGIVLGYFLKWGIHFAYLNTVISCILFIILFIIGHQLKLQGISLKNIFANKLGFVIALVIIFSSFLAAFISSEVLNLNLKSALMLSSGFGWYTLSGILNGQLINHSMGTISFFIDFLREIISILLIPTLGARFSIPLIGYCGATALDFTLPIIKENLGEAAVPIAITSGMVLTVLVPILIPLIGSLGVLLSQGRFFTI